MTAWCWRGVTRALATHSWFALNPSTRVQCFRSNVSNHYPIVIKPEGIVGRLCKPFRFEHMAKGTWLRRHSQGGVGDSSSTLNLSVSA